MHGVVPKHSMKKAVAIVTVQQITQLLQRQNIIATMKNGLRSSGGLKFPISIKKALQALSEVGNDNFWPSRAAQAR